MTIAEFLTSWVAIITAGCISALFMYLLIFRYKEVIDWEAEHIWSKYDELCARAKTAIRNLLRKSDKLVKWANQPTKHGRPDRDFISGQVKTFGDVWR